MLTSKQRAQLRAQSNPLETTLMIGKEGITEGLIASAKAQLAAFLPEGNVAGGETAALAAPPPRRCRNRPLFRPQLPC